MMNTEALLKVEDKEFALLLPFRDILSRVSAMAEEINRDYDGKNPVFIPVLNGSFMFASDLIREICIPCQVSFVKSSSYEGTTSAGRVNQLIGLQQEVAGRHLLLLEDIVDTGQTIAALLPQLQALAPASIEIASLFQKPDSFGQQFKVKYTGFTIPDRFIVGYGLDYRGFGRNFRDVYCLTEKG